MTDIQQKQPAGAIDWEQDKKKLPDMLNVLTILTFVGCGIGLISSCWGFMHSQTGYDDLLAVQGNLENAPDFAKKLAGPEMLEIARKSLENRLPLLLLGLVGYALCLYGAIQMRALKKQGFSIYVIGEIVPIAASLIFIGTAALMGWAIAFALLFPAIFIILYATQVKYMS
jgi:hypothetical protein